MSSNLVSFFLDIAVLIFLAATIVYVIKLTRSLNDFKAHRREFDGVIANLLSSIDHADRSVKELKQVSEVEAAELSALISQSKIMSEELRVINEAGDAMAKRLEAAAENSRKTVEKTPPLSSKPRGRRVDYASKLKNIRKPAIPDSDDELPSFMINDEQAPSVGADEVSGNDDFDGLKSQAEQELFAALNTNNSGKSKRINRK